MARRIHLKVSWAVLGAAMLCAVVSASAQVPPSRDRGGGKDVPRYVDSADYDPQPYYVDGVEYKPYVPDKKKAKPAATTAGTAPQPVTPAQPAPAPELHPYVPPSSVVAKADPVPKPAAPSGAAASSAASATAYVQKKRPRYGAAIIEALDKVTAESVRFEAPIGQPVRYKGLIYLVKACETTADDEPQSDVIAYMQVRTSPVAATNMALGSKSKEVFHGWTFASTPSVNPMQHPVYDAWVIGCRKPMSGTAS